jgi:hypothetical protein
MSVVQKYSGTWTLFKETQSYKGELYINRERHSIDLVLTICATPENLLPCPPHRGKIPFVSGTLFSGTKILLYECITGEEHLVISKYVRQKIRARYAVLGLEIESVQEVVFPEVYFDFGNVIEWSGLCSYEAKLREDENFDLYWKYGKPVIFDMSENLKLTFFATQGAMELHGFAKKIEVEQQVWGKFTYKKPAPVNVIIEDAICIQYLIGLGIGNIVEIENAKCMHSSIYTEHNNEGVCKKTYRPVDFFLGTGSTFSTPHVSRNDYFFTLEDVVKNDVFTKWILNYPTLKPVLDLYFTAFSNYTGTLEMLFLNITQALETYHARFVTDDVKDYVEIVDKSYDDIPPKWKGLLLKEGQRTARHIFLASRIAYLLFKTSTEASIVSMFLPPSYKLEDYINKVVDTRHYYTHYNPAQQAKSFSKDELPLINGYLLALLQYHMLTLLGFDGEEVRKKLVSRLKRLVNTYNVTQDVLSDHTE